MTQKSTNSILHLPLKNQINGDLNNCHSLQNIDTNNFNKLVKKQFKEDQPFQRYHNDSGQVQDQQNQLKENNDVNMNNTYNVKKLRKQISVDKINSMNSRKQEETNDDFCQLIKNKPKLKLNIKQGHSNNNNHKVSDIQHHIENTINFNSESIEAKEKLDFNKTVELIHNYNPKSNCQKTLNLESKMNRSNKNGSTTKYDQSYQQHQQQLNVNSESLNQQCSKQETAEQLNSLGITYQYNRDQPKDTQVQSMSFEQTQYKTFQNRKSKLLQTNTQQVIQEENSQEESSIIQTTNNESLQQNLHNIIEGKQRKLRISRNSKGQTQISNVKQSISLNSKQIMNDNNIESSNTEHYDYQQDNSKKQSKKIRMSHIYTKSLPNDKLNIKYATQTNNTKVNIPENVGTENKNDIESMIMNVKVSDFNSTVSVADKNKKQLLSNKSRRSLIKLKPNKQGDNSQVTNFNNGDNAVLNQNKNDQPLQITDLQFIDEKHLENQENDLIQNLRQSRHKFTRQQSQEKLQQQNKNETKPSVKYQPPLQIQTNLTINMIDNQKNMSDAVNTSTNSTKNGGGGGNQSFRGRKYGISPRGGGSNNNTSNSRPQSTTPSQQDNQNINTNSNSQDEVKQEQKIISEATIVRRSLQAAKQSIEQELKQNNPKLQVSQSLQQLKSSKANDSNEQYIIVPINRSKKIEQDSQLKHLSKVVNELLKEQIQLKSKLNHQEQIISTLAQSQSQQHFYQPSTNGREDVMRDNMNSGGSNSNNERVSLNNQQRTSNSSKNSFKFKLKQNKGLLYNSTNSNHHLNMMPQDNAAHHINHANNNFNTVQSKQGMGICSTQNLLQYNKGLINSNSTSNIIQSLKQNAGFQRYLDQTKRIKSQVSSAQTSDYPLSQSEYNNANNNINNNNKTSQKQQQQLKSLQMSTTFGVNQQENHHRSIINIQRDKSQAAQLIKNTYQNIVVNLNHNSTVDGSTPQININPISLQKSKDQQNSYQISTFNPGNIQKLKVKKQQLKNIDNTQQQNQEYYAKQDIKVLKKVKRDKSQQQQKYNNLQIEIQNDESTAVNNCQTANQIDNDQLQQITKLALNQIQTLPPSQGSQSQDDSAYNFSFSGRSHNIGCISNELESSAQKQYTPLQMNERNSDCTHSPHSLNLQSKYNINQQQNPHLPRIQTMESNYSNNSQFSHQSNNQSSNLQNHHQHNNNRIGLINSKKFPKDFFSPQNQNSRFQQQNMQLCDNNFKSNNKSQFYEGSQTTTNANTQALNKQNQHQHEQQMTKYDVMRETFGNMNFTQAHRASMEFTNKNSNKTQSPQFNDQQQ